MSTRTSNSSPNRGRFFISMTALQPSSKRSVNAEHIVLQVLTGLRFIMARSAYWGRLLTGLFSCGGRHCVGVRALGTSPYSVRPLSVTARLTSLQIAIRTGNVRTIAALIVCMGWLYRVMSGVRRSESIVSGFIRWCKLGESVWSYQYTLQILNYMSFFSFIFYQFYF